jgi:hypothetical protein
VEQLVASRFVRREASRLFVRRDERVVANIGDVAFELRELRVVTRVAVDAEQIGLVPAV